MEVLGRMRNVDRRVLYVFMALMVLLPVVHPFSLPFFVSEPARRFFEAVQAVPQKKLVIVAADFDAGTQGENLPQTRAVIEHLMRKGKKFAIFGFQQQGPEMAQAAAEQIAATIEKELADKFEKQLLKEGLPKKEAKKKAAQLAAKERPQYGRDWCNWGYRPPGAAALAFLTNLGRDVPGTVKRDFQNTPISQIPVMQGIKDHKDIGLIAEFTGSGFLDWYLQTIHGTFKTPLAQGCTGIIGPEDFPYLDSGQLKGILIGMKGAAEYEKLVHEMSRSADLQNNNPNQRTKMRTIIPQKELEAANRRGLLAMTPQSMGHLVIMIAIILGNLGLYASRRLERRQRS